MMVRLSFKATPLLLAIFSIGMSGSKPCLCGNALNDEIEYQAPTSDSFDPAPRVVAIKNGPSGEIVQIAVSIPSRQIATREALFTSSNFGKTWTRQSTRTILLQEVSRSTVRYRAPLTRDYLERSTDGGRHWNKALLQLDAPDQNGGQRKWSVELAAVHPTNPLIIYGCFAQLNNPSEPTVKGGHLVLDGIYKSTDGGDHWSLFTDNFHPKALAVC